MGGKRQSCMFQISLCGFTLGSYLVVAQRKQFQAPLAPRDIVSLHSSHAEIVGPIYESLTASPRGLSQEQRRQTGWPQLEQGILDWCFRAIQGFSFVLLL